MTPVRCRLTGHRYTWTTIRLDGRQATVERCRRPGCGVTRVRYGR